jgi:hypothetical protein
MTEKLLPCPCCRSTNLELILYGEPRCIDCGLEGASVDLWNTRHLHLEVQAVIAGVQKDYAHAKSQGCDYIFFSKETRDALDALDSEGRK